MLKALLLFAGGAALALLVANPVIIERAVERRVRAELDARSAMVVELVDDAPQRAGFPPAAASGVVRGDSAAARRQSVARAVRDLERRPPATGAAELPVEKTTEIADRLRVRLRAHLDREGDRP